MTNSTNISILDDEAVGEIEALSAKVPEGPWFVDKDDAEDVPDHRRSGLALVDTGRSSDWWIARLCEWRTARFIAESKTNVDALCQTVRALRAKYESLKSKIAWHRDGVGPDVPVLQERYDKLIAQRNDLQSQLEQVTKERDDLRADNGKLSSVIFSNEHAQLVLSSAIALCRDKAVEYRKELEHYERGEEEFAQLNSYAAAADVLARELEQLK